MSINYDHRQNRHTLAGPRAVVPVLFADETPTSLLDVGCGVGTWLKAALEFGVRHVHGVDGANLSSASLVVTPNLFQVIDLSTSWDLGRTFDVALCLEVAEHLDERAAPLLIEMLSRHADKVVFSAACPGQPGQHHVNCQWPDYWQRLFNANGFVCSDAIRWSIWDDRDVEVWYRQNMFVAVRDSSLAGTEPRIKAVMHPDFMPDFIAAGASRGVAATMTNIEQGTMGLEWYAAATAKAVASKLRRRCIQLANRSA